MTFLKFSLLFITMIFMIMGCFSNSQTVLGKNGADKINAQSIAILPIESNDSESKASNVLRLKLFDEIYFKGYSKISLDEMDAKLKSLPGDSKTGGTGAIPPLALKDAVGADAGMYCSLTENYKTRIFYLPVKITVVCELRSTDNGTILWNAQSESTGRYFDLTDKRLKKKLSDGFETLINDVVDKIIKKLPDGPMLSS